ncbi:unnamed protein product, partial [Ectocarpus sp. 12 AP-2014]
MATLTQSTGDMIDTFRVDGKGRLIQVIEQLNSTAQDVMDDWSWMECNSGTKHTRTARTGLTSNSWGALYEGVAASKGSIQSVSDTTGFVESLAQIDKRQLDLYADKEAAIRAQESKPHIESMSQELLTAFFYHNTDTNARHPKGLGARYNSLGTSGAANQVIDATGSGSDNTSIWFVEWSFDGTSVIY